MLSQKIFRLQYKAAHRGFVTLSLYLYHRGGGDGGSDDDYYVSLPKSIS